MDQGYKIIMDTPPSLAKVEGADPQRVTLDRVADVQTTGNGRVPTTVHGDPNSLEIQHPRVLAVSFWSMPRYGAAIDHGVAR